MNAHFDLSRIAAIADDLDKLLGGDDERLFHDMIVGESDIDRIVQRVHDQIARDEEMLVGITQRQENLAERKKRIEYRKNAAKAFIGKALRTARLTKLELPEVSYSVREGKASLTVVSPDAVPEELCRVKREPNKTAINEAYADKDELPNWLIRLAPMDVVTARTK